MKAVKIQQLYKSFGDHVAINGLDLEIKEGEIFGLLGPNGAGKSTMINILCYLFKYEKGNIEVFNQKHHVFQQEIKRQLGIVPQDLAVFEELSAWENVRFFGELYGYRKDELTRLTKEALEFVGLSDRSKDKVKTFSGGMKRRLNIACGIVHQPQLVIMDEPTVGIDPQSRNYILHAIKKLNEKGTTIIYTTHYMEEAEQLCDRIAIMNEGTIIATGTSDELKGIISDHHTLEVMIRSIENVQIHRIQQIKGVEQVTISENKLIIISKKEIPCLTDIVLNLTEQEAVILEISTKVHSLEDVFLTLTGRNLRD